MIKLLIGGSPCTFWSIAQKNNRETEAEGLGWELFKNYLVAKEKFEPDFFLYENNKSAAQAIKDQISRELGVDLMYINSNLVSAQNRQRFYAFNWEVEQPEDRGILLRDILESGTTWKDKQGVIDANYYKGGNYSSPKKQSGQRMSVAEPVGVGYRNRREEDGKLYRRFETHGEEKANALTTVQTDSMVAEPVFERILCAVPCRSMPVKEATKKGYTEIEPMGCVDMTQPNSKTRRGRNMADKSNCCMTSCQYYQYCGVLCYATPCEWDENGKVIKAISAADGKTYTVYEVKDGHITIKDKQYPIKLVDGHYIIRKLTPVECERLQTMPDGYTKAVSDTQRYKGLGNGWTAEVIIHILNGALKDVPRDEEIVVLSMYDGIGTGRYCLDKMGFTNVKYYAYEIDKYVKQVALDNYPDIIHMGNAFDLRNPDWTIGY